LLQSVGLETPAFENIYRDFVKEGFREKFLNSNISRIDGIISYSGAADDVNKITKSNGWSHYLTVPAFYRFNYDDDRVHFEQAFNAILPLDGINYNPYITLSINRRGASDGFDDVDDIEEIKDIISDRNPSSDNNPERHSTTKGHFNTNNKDLDSQVVHFICNAQQYVYSPLHHARQRRLFDLHKINRKSPERFGLKIAYPDNINNDIQQFLSNLRNTQQYIIAGKILTSEETYRHHMMFVNEDFIDIALKFRKSLTEKEKKELDSVAASFTKAPYESRNFSNIEKQDIIDFYMQYPGFRELYEAEQKKYHDALMRYTTTRGLWKNALDRLKETQRKIRKEEFKLRQITPVPKIPDIEVGRSARDGS